MAKISFNKLKCKINEEIKTINFAEENIEVKQYLPTQEKLALIGRVITAAHEEDGNYSNPVKINVFTDLEIVFTYTNISFTEKQKEDKAKLYDLIVSSGLVSVIKQNIPETELAIIEKGIQDTIVSVYTYQNSILGLLDNIQNNYNISDKEIENMSEELLNLANSPIVQDIIPLLGQ